MPVYNVCMFMSLFKKACVVLIISPIKNANDFGFVTPILKEADLIW